MIRISHKRVECIGCGVCADLAPEYWNMDEDGLASLNKITHRHSTLEFGEALDMDRELLQETEDNCPVNIIKVEN